MENVSLDEHSMNSNSQVPSAVMMTFYVFLYVIVEVLGNFLLLSMITYEKYGMDSQKRTVTNQLLSSICISFIILNVIAMTIAMFHRIYHPFLITLCKKIILFQGWLRESFTIWVLVMTKYIYSSRALKNHGSYGNSVLFLQRSQYISLDFYVLRKIQNGKCGS